jgi:phosphohistidine swiveling domain-containing protein
MGAFAGAFTSMGGLQREDLPTAVRGCWASIFAPDAIGRLQRAGVTPGAVELAVLIQPEISPVAGGWAARTPDGGAEIASIAGSPGPLLSGSVRGVRHVVDPDGSLKTHDGDRASLIDRLALRVAELLRLAHAELGADRIEWADDSASLVLLQVGRMGAGGRRSDVRHRDTPADHGSLADPIRQRFTRVMIGRTGRLADRILVPWAAAAPASVVPTRIEDDPRSLIASARAWAGELAADLVARSGMPMAALMDRLLVGDPTLADDLGDLEVDAGLAGRVLGAVEAVGAALSARQILDDPVAIWWQDYEWITSALGGGPQRPPRAWVPDRWTALLFQTIASSGDAASGLAASPGRATGRVVIIDRPDAAGVARARDILVVSDPLPAFAPLLWTVAGVVSRDGDPAAHLFEVARSRRIPAVAGIGATPTSTGDAMAIDGDAGEAWSWPAHDGAVGRPSPS